jgi:hypothetical protein
MGGETETHDAVIGFWAVSWIWTERSPANYQETERRGIPLKFVKDKNPATIAGPLSLLKTKN